MADASAYFGAVFIKVGLTACDIGTSYFLPRIVGATRAAELMLTGRHFSAEDAERYGLVNRLVEAGSHVDSARDLASAIAANNEYGVWLTERGLWTNVDAPSLRHAVELENRQQVLGTFTGNMGEAIQAFSEKRAPEWGPM